MTNDETAAAPATGGVREALNEQVYDIVCATLRHMNDDIMFVVHHMDSDSEAKFYALLDRIRQWLIDVADATPSLPDHPPAAHRTEREAKSGSMADRLWRQFDWKCQDSVEMDVLHEACEHLDALTPSATSPSGSDSARGEALREALPRVAEAIYLAYCDGASANGARYELVEQRHKETVWEPKAIAALANPQDDAQESGNASQGKEV